MSASSKRPRNSLFSHDEDTHIEEPRNTPEPRPKSGSKGSKYKGSSKGNSSYAPPDRSSQERKRDESEREYDTEDVVESLRRLTLRLSSQVRAHTKLTHFVLLIQPQADTLRSSLFAARKQWLDEMPERGKSHDMGSMPSYLFATFKSYIERDLEPSKLKQHQLADARMVSDFLSSCFPFGNETDSTVYTFGAKGQRSRIPTGVWVWQLAFDYTSEAGLQSHQRLLRIVDLALLESDYFQIKRDSAPPDENERRLQKMPLGKRSD